MNRHEAYRLLASALEGYRTLPFGDLSRLVGDHRSERAFSPAGEEFILEVSVSWANEPPDGIRVHATVDSPSSFRMERVEGDILVSGEAV